MASVDSIEGGAVSLFPLEVEDTKVECCEEEVAHTPVAPYRSSSGMVRMREEEGIVRVLSANLRELDSQMKISEALDRIDSLDHWNKDPFYLFCVQKLAPSYPQLALKCAEKLFYSWNQAQAYLEIAKYESGPQLSSLLQKAADHFCSYTAEYFVPYYDELLARGEETRAFFNTIYSRIQLALRWGNPDFLYLLAQVELQIKLKLPGIDETLRKAHDALYMMPECYRERIVRLLECEKQVKSPLLFETLGKVRGFSITEFSGLEYMIMLLDFEAKYPELAEDFERDLEEILLLAEEDNDLCDILLGITTLSKPVAEKIAERIEDKEYRLLANLFITRCDTQDPHFNSEAAFQELKEKVESVSFTYPDTLIEIFKVAAEIFGPQRSQFLLEKALELSQPTIDVLYSKELKEATQNLTYYLGQALGVEYTQPQSEEDIELSKFANLHISRINRFLEAYSQYDLPETREILQLLYDKHKRGESIFYFNEISIVRAEFTLLGI